MPQRPRRPDVGECGAIACGFVHAAETIPGEGAVLWSDHQTVMPRATDGRPVR
jgi:hypothetical protein